MIIDSIENLHKYTQVHPLFAKVAQFIQSNNLEKLEKGKIQLQGDDLYANVTTAKGKKACDARLEAHEEYIDIQVPLSITETIGYTPTACCKEIDTPYDKTDDILFYKDKPESYMNVHPGMFIIFFPQDAHAPCIADEDINKIIFKVRI